MGVNLRQGDRENESGLQEECLAVRKMGRDQHEEASATVHQLK